MAAACAPGDMLRAMRGVASVIAAGAFAAVAAFVTSGCGPVVYISEVTRNASDAVEAARAAKADKYSPYYWTRATEYLHSARAQAAHADFQGANHFGRLAAEAAEKAVAEANAHAHDLPATAPKPASGTGVAPAKDTE